MPETYTEYEFIVVRHSDGAFIPRDPDNLDYQEYLRIKANQDQQPISQPSK